MIDYKSIPDDFLFEVELIDGTTTYMNKDSFKTFLNDSDLCISSNGVLYNNITYDAFGDASEDQGIIPEILTLWFNERVKLRKLEKEYGSELIDGKINTKYSKDKYKEYNRRQLVQKILLNSVYGVLGLKTFRYYDLDNAESFTKTGVDAIKFASKIINTYINKRLNTTNVDYVTYTDTDSVFINLIDIIRKEHPSIDEDDESQVVPIILKLSDEMRKYINDNMTKFSKSILNVGTHYFDMKQEIIAKSGLWTAKKRYALAVINENGIEMKKIEIKGLDAVRSSFPELYKTFMKKMLQDILDFKTKEQIDEDINNIMKETDTIDPAKIAITTSVKSYNKYDNSDYLFGDRDKGTPIQYKSVLNFNDYLEKNGISQKYGKIQASEKVKYVYLERNPYNIQSIAFRGASVDPKELTEFILKYIDRDKMCSSQLEKKIQSFYDALGWGSIPKKSLVYIDYIE